MKAQFDKKLSEKIKDSFRHYEEPYDPKAWDKLAAAYFKPKKGLMDRPWFLRAAALALILGFSALFYWILSSKNDSAPLQSQLTSNENPIISDSLGFSESDGIGLSGNSEEEKEPQPAFSPIPELSNTEKKSAQDLETIRIPEFILAEAQMPEKIMQPINEKADSLAVNYTLQTNFTAVPEKPLITMNEEEATAAILQWLNEGKGEEVQKTTEKENPVKLGLMLIPQSTNSSNQSLNLGAGLVSEIPLSKRLKIDIGMAYASQNLNPGNNLDAFLMANVETTAADRLSSMSNNIINSSNEFRFGQLEIPINLKYSILQSKTSGLYVLSGISNMVFLNQRNVTTFNVANLGAFSSQSGQSAVQRFSQTVRPEELSGNETVGQLVNFGIGYEYGLKNGTFISIEPFYKTSLGSQTFLGQQFSIGGLNLRMNFQIKK
ncbi:outer membrane beta-barrel protein [Cecembia sp.]|uniref:outer membrane beta-barrel protein n=1 Tax=Cecembia sp. TaxID=1898110 RepID=UPI0025C093BD|nr:outer membrane beta-barrel protein [Cecembia sp.]